MNERSHEIEFVSKLIECYPRTPRQVNRPFASDAEILETDSGFVISSLDTVSEEYALGVLRDAKSFGWLTAAASISDLAACGVRTQSLSVQLGLPKADASWIEAFRAGSEEAARAAGAGLGEFLQFHSPAPVSSATAVALQKTAPSLSREGFRPGATLYLTGPIGWGNAVALANFAIRPKNAQYADLLDQTYRPRNRSQEGVFLNGFSEACIDTSDGLLFTLDFLCEFGGVGFEIDWCDALFHPRALEVAQLIGVAKFLFFAGQSGEFELLTCVDPQREQDFRLKASAQGLGFLSIGRVVERPGITINSDGRRQALNIAPIRNLLHNGVSPENYVAALIALSHQHSIL